MRINGMQHKHILYIYSNQIVWTFLSTLKRNGLNFLRMCSTTRKNDFWSYKSYNESISPTNKFADLTNRKVGDLSRGWPQRFPFQYLPHRCVGEGTSPSPGLLHFTLDIYLMILSVKCFVFGMTRPGTELRSPVPLEKTTSFGQWPSFLETFVIMRNLYIHIPVYIHIYVCVCVCNSNPSTEAGV